MTESRIEKLTRIGQEMAAAVAEMRADAADVTTQNPETAALVEELSVTCDRWSQWEEVAAVALTHLQSTNRLIPAGGMALTAEEAEDVRTMLWSPGVSALDAFRRLRALFPATEPAEVATQSAGGDCFDVCEGHPAPAEPAEEETKAEDESGWHWVQSAGGYYSGPACTGGYGCRSMAHYEGCLRPSLTASSPVVPAPTETGPWQDISEAPKHLTLIDRVGDKWTYDGDNWVTPETAILPVLYINRKYAPFVAAEEG